MPAAPRTLPLLVNIGCGAVFHKDWVNLDVAPSDPAVRRWDARSGLPFDDGAVVACYASHVLEHLSKVEASRLLAECQRVLRPGGVIRLVVPDLEGIARHYVRLLDAAEGGSAEAVADYDWILLELFDQMVRTESGGEMHRYLTGKAIPNRPFVVARVGLEAEAPPTPAPQLRVPSLRRVSRRVREEAVAFVAGALLGRDGRAAVKEGLFRRSGQVHLWMYDRFSLRRVLEQSGFRDPRRCAADQSRIPGFAGYDLDTVGGRVRKPDSLFMEAVKP
jgi:SAM-dependent methyltransferase